MKPTLLALLLASSLAFQDASTKGSPLSLSIKIDPSDGKPYIHAQSTSTKEVLAVVSVVKFTEETGKVVPLNIGQDYAFKSDPLKFQEERDIAPIFGVERGVKITQAIGTVLFVQFEDESTWGHPETGKPLLDSDLKNSLSSSVLSRHTTKAERTLSTLNFLSGWLLGVCNQMPNTRRPLQLT
jgi:hypothetical protein